MSTCLMWICSNGNPCGSLAHLRLVATSVPITTAVVVGSSHHLLPLQLSPQTEFRSCCCWLLSRSFRPLVLGYHTWRRSLQALVRRVFSSLFGGLHCYDALTSSSVY